MMAQKEKNCIFCGIAGKAIGALVVYENQGAVAFLDVHPRSPGHTLVVPKMHTPALPDVPDEALLFLAQAVKEVARRLVPALGADGLTIGINQGEASGQVVEHVHVHLIPRFKGDGGGSVQSVVEMPSEPLEDVHKKITAAF